MIHDKRSSLASMAALIVALLFAACSAPKTTMGNAADMHRFDSLYLTSVKCRLSGDFAQQYDLLNEALLIRPNAPEVMFDLGTAIVYNTIETDSIDYHKGEELMEKAVALMPENRAMRSELASYYTDGMNLEQAIKHYEVLNEQKANTDFMQRLVMLYEETGRNKEALKVIEKLEQHEGTNESFVWRKALNLMTLKDTVGAYETIENFCKEHPEQPNLRVMKAEFYERNGHYANAIEECEKVLEKEPDNAQAQFRLLNIYRSLLEYEKHLHYVKRILRNPNTPYELAKFSLIDYYKLSESKGWDKDVLKGLMEDAVKLTEGEDEMVVISCEMSKRIGMSEASRLQLLQSILEINPANPVAVGDIINIYSSKNDMTSLFEVASNAFEHNQQSATFLYLASASLVGISNTEKTLNYISKRIDGINLQDNLEISSELYEIYADLLEEENRKEEAFAAYEKSIELDPKNYSSLNNYAYFLSLENRELEKAAEMSRKTLEAEPKNAVYLDTYAWILYLLQQYEQAKIYIVQAIANVAEEAENATIFDHAGDIHFQTGDKEGAMKHWKTALRLCNEKELQKQLEKKIKQGKV